MSLLLFLPTEEAGWRWMRVGEGPVSAGEGVPAEPGPVIAVAPAEAVTLHWAALPDRSLAQATAAARVLVGEASAAPAGDLHVAVGHAGGAERPIGVVAATTVRGWLDQLAAAGVEAGALVPAPMLLPRPDRGFIRADVAGRPVVRGPTSGFADEPELTALVTAGDPPEPIDAAVLEESLAAAAAAPPLDLRQGAFARRRRAQIDWVLVRRLALLALAVLLVTLAIDVVRLVRLNVAASAAEQRADVLARGGLPRGETVTDPSRQLAERLSRVRGPGRGFSSTVAAVYAAVRTVPGSEVTAMTFLPDGSLLVSLATQRESAPTDLKRAIEANGYQVRAGVFQSANGRVAGQFTVHTP